MKALIEKMCLSLAGETPERVAAVLPSFVAVVCDQVGLSIDDFIKELRVAVLSGEALDQLSVVPKDPPS